MSTITKTPKTYEYLIDVYTTDDTYPHFQVGSNDESSAADTVRLFEKTIPGAEVEIQEWVEHLAGYVETSISKLEGE